MRYGWAIVAAAGAWCGAGCETAPEPKPSPPTNRDREQAAAGPERVTVDHILIGIANPKLPGVERDDYTARKLAYEIWDRVQKGARWDDLKRDHTDDRSAKGLGGPYTMVNHGIAPANKREFPRKGMVPSFGDVSFGLAVGEVAVANYDPKRCKWGYHVIKRIR